MNHAHQAGKGLLMTMQTLLTLKAPVAAPVRRVTQPVAAIARPACFCEDISKLRRCRQKAL